MRVISGRYKGRRLAGGVPGETRPSTDRFRETLFNVLGPEIEQARCLDLFAGSGAIGIEALSRGARHVVFNDKSPRAVRLIEKNLSRCGIREGFEIHQKDAVILLKKLRMDSLDFVFIDPPYAYHNHVKLLAALREQPALTDATRVTLELFRKMPLPRMMGWEVARERAVGESRIIFLRPA